MKITIEIPNSYSIYFNKKNIEKEVKKNNALILYKQGKISLSKAVELSDSNIYDFIKECKDNEIPVIDYDSEDIKKEMEKIKNLIL